MRWYTLPRKKVVGVVGLWFFRRGKPLATKSYQGVKLLVGRRFSVSLAQRTTCSFARRLSPYGGGCDVHAF